MGQTILVNLKALLAYESSFQEAKRQHPLLEKAKHLYEEGAALEKTFRRRCNRRSQTTIWVLFSEP